MQPLDEVRDDAETLWRLQAVNERLTEIANAALERARGGESLDEIADGIAGARVEAGTFSRSDTAAPFGREAVGMAFQIDPGSFERTLAADRRAHVIVTLNEVIAAEAPTDAELAELQAALEERYSADLDEAFVSALQQRYPPSVNTALRDQVLGVTSDQ